MDCKYWQAGVCDHHNKLTVGSSIAVLHSLQYHLSTMDLWRLTPVGLGDVRTASLKGWQYRAGGGVSAQLKLFSHLHTQNKDWQSGATLFHSLSLSHKHTQTLTEKTSVIKWDCDVLIKKYYQAWLKGENERICQWKEQFPYQPTATQVDGKGGIAKEKGKKEGFINRTEICKARRRRTETWLNSCSSAIDMAST